MNDVFHSLLIKYVLVFFNDILIYSGTWMDHLQHLQSFLHLLSQHKFYINKKKCSFGHISVEYLGHTIHKQGVTMQSSKIQVVVNWPVPKSVKGVWGFLGLTGYYRKFIQGYGCIEKPLMALTKKDNFS